MQVKEIAPGLWRWTVPHPSWTPEKDKPGGWGKMVGCHSYQPPPDAERSFVLFDPQAPPRLTPESERFWTSLDNDVDRIGTKVAVLLGNYYHQRSAKEIVDRYYKRTCSIWAHESAASHLEIPLTFFKADTPLPGGVKVYLIEGLDDAEVAYYITPHRALVFADAVLGKGAGTRVESEAASGAPALQVAPLSWARDTEAGKEAYRTRFRPSLRRLLDLKVDMLLTAHGEPVLKGGREALAEALEAPAWGE